MTKEETIATLESIRSTLLTLNDVYELRQAKKVEEPPTLSDILDWKEEQEYEWRGDIFRIQSDILQVYDKDDECWYDSTEELNDYLRLRQAKKVEPRLKAWYVRDEYSYVCLMKELEEQGYLWITQEKPTELDYGLVNHEDGTVYFDETGDKRIVYSTLRSFNQGESDRYDLIEYHKEKPRYLLQTDLTSENGIQYLSFDRKRRKYFIGALIASDNVQQRFTDDEITKIKTITRFAKLCKKIKVEGIEDTIHHVCIDSINDRSALCEVTGTELDWLYQNMKDYKGYWNFSSDSGELLIDLNNVTEIVNEEVE